LTTAFASDELAVQGVWPMRIIAACLLALTVATSVKAAGVDWNMYAYPTIDEQRFGCFYDAHGVAQTSDRHVRVWTKCLLAKDLEAVNIQSDLGGKIEHNAGRRLKEGYVPPIAAVLETDTIHVIMVTFYEEIANIGEIKSHSRIFYELSCSERMMRMLSTYVKSFDGKDHFDDEPSSWEYVSPEGGVAALLKILCPMQ
jgi:hypothetical protein